MVWNGVILSMTWGWSLYHYAACMYGGEAYNNLKMNNGVNRVGGGVLILHFFFGRGGRMWELLRELPHTTN